MSKEISKNKITRRYFIALCIDSADGWTDSFLFNLREVDKLGDVSLEFSCFDETSGKMARVVIAIMLEDKKSMVHWTRINLNRLYGILERYYGLSIGKIMPEWIE